MKAVVEKSLCIVFLSVAIMLSSACVLLPVGDTNDSIVIASGYPITEYQGEGVASLFSLKGFSGEQKMTVRFSSHRFLYDCQFIWFAEDGSKYEVRHDDSPTPLMLYQWVRVNKLWAELISPVAPDNCAISKNN